MQSERFFALLQIKCRIVFLKSRRYFVWTCIAFSANVILDRLEKRASTFWKSRKKSPLLVFKNPAFAVIFSALLFLHHFWLNKCSMFYIYGNLEINEKKVCSQSIIWIRNALVNYDQSVYLRNTRQPITTSTVKALAGTPGLIGLVCPPPPPNMYSILTTSTCI